MYNVLAIMRGTTVDGPGFRTSVYLAGCSHACPGCHNPSSWDSEGGSGMSLEEIMEIVREEDFDVTLSGGDPLFNPVALLPLVEALKKDGRSIWLYTGFLWEEILNDPDKLRVVENVDVVVDGPFIQNMRDTDLLFRGSSNQRLVDVRKSLETGKVVIYSR
ncbi:MAG: anaerobic ribonucleoside-triphosphate reductase activating protein [Bacteroides sp.]|nr:anaerobic ribonucleoside-triphosphate reductase activating protein [Bacteroides sp.]